MKFFTNYKFSYCGKCSDGYIKTILNTGEEILTVCECKLKYDSKFIYNNLVKESNIQYTTYLDYDLNNSEKFIKTLLDGQLSIKVYEAIYFNFLKTTSTKLVSIPEYLKFIGESDLLHNKINFSIFNNFGWNDGLNFFSNFTLNILLKRLIPAKILSFSELQAIFMDIKKYDIEKFSQGFDVIILTKLFCDEMIESLKHDFKYERLNKFLFELFNTTECSIYTVSDKYINNLRDLSLNPKLNPDKVLSSRVNTVLDLILNKSKTVITQLK
jgi:hypothetical protein